MDYYSVQMNKNDLIKMYINSQFMRSSLIRYFLTLITPLLINDDVMLTKVLFKLIKINYFLHHNYAIYLI